MDNSIAIIVPVYNVEQYLKLCLQSIIEQTKCPNEVILIDDGSTDKSGIICDEYAARYDYIKVIHQENKGLSSARNTGINCCDSHYFILLDSDDIIEKNTIEKFSKVSNNKEADIVVGNILSFWPNRTVKKIHTNQDSSIILDGKEYLKIELKNKTMYYEAVQSMYSRDFIINNNLLFMPGLIHEDQLFSISVLLSAKKVLPTDIVFYRHMIRENSISTQKDKTPNAKSIIKICYLIEKLVREGQDLELNNMIMEHCVDLYYKVYIDAELINKPNIRIEKSFLTKNSKTIKNKIRTFLYRFNEKLFDKFERMRKKRG